MFRGMAWGVGWWWKSVDLIRQQVSIVVAWQVWVDPACHIKGAGGVDSVLIVMGRLAAELLGGTMPQCSASRIRIFVWPQRIYSLPRLFPSQTLGIYLWRTHIPALRRRGCVCGNLSRRLLRLSRLRTPHGGIRNSLRTARRVRRLRWVRRSPRKPAGATSIHQIPGRMGSFHCLFVRS